jgi:N6-L-threonylcarbamoyladenine synthase
MILAIETSCDETAVALHSLNPGGGRVLEELVASQVLVHEQYGGVVPEIAAREHLNILPGLVHELLRRAGIAKEEITEVAVTEGPGLKGCLLVGSMFARGVAEGLGIGVRSINHIEGHLLAPMMDNPSLAFPFLGVVVSGGHSEVVLARGYRKYEILTRTIDDAVGEAFDKSASMLGIPYPGGPVLAKLADAVSNSPFRLPLVMKDRPEMSFSGLKTAVRTLVQKCVRAEPLAEYSIRTEFGYLSKELQGQLAHTIQFAIVEALMLKIRNCVQLTGIPVVAVTGGVAANLFLRSEIGRIQGVELFTPTMAHCTDNAGMIAYAAYCAHNAGIPTTPPTKTGEIRSRWPLDQLTEKLR